MKGYQIIDQRFIAEENSQLTLYRHEKTGAQVLHMANDDDNKTFFIGFATPPIGETGNCHIMEHSVLDGSEKYRTKDPFFEMIGSSLNTFMNAMTFPEKTLYPFASRNSKDFYNLMDLYLDSVFFPAVLKDDLIFRREGWHYALLNKEDPIKIQGVVYSEMKGAMSPAERQIDDYNLKALYPDTIYACNSGGDPAVIPQLDYETFRQFHADYYHPSNARIFLYGDMDLEESLNHLSAYLDRFEAKEIQPMAVEVKAFAEPREEHVEYSLSPAEDPKGKTCLSYNWLVDHVRVDEDLFVYNLLGKLLIDSESSPLRRALLEELGAEDVYYQLSDLKDIGFSIIAKNVQERKEELFKTIVEKQLKAICEKGIDQQVLEGLANSMEYQLREKWNEATKGIVLGILVYNEWTYGEDPLERLAYADKLEKLREKLAQGYMEEYIQKHMLDNPHRVLVCFTPHPGLSAEREEELAKKLAAYKASLSEEELDQLIAQNQALIDRENKEDSPEDKATLPYLTREDLPQSIPRIDRQLKKVGDDTYLLHHLPTSGIEYMDLVFDASSVSMDEAPYLALALSLMGKLDTEHYSYEQYEREEKLNTGGITSAFQLFQISHSTQFKRRVLVSTKILGTDKLDKALDLIDEQILRTRFEDKDRMQEQVRILASTMEMNLVNFGSYFAGSAAEGAMTPYAAYLEAIDGLAYYQFLKKLAKGISDQEIQKIQAVYQRVFHQPRRVVNLTSTADKLDLLQEAVSRHLSQIETRAAAEVPVSFEAQPIAKAYIGSSDVQFCALAGLLPDNHQFTGRDLVLSNCLTSDYLYGELRAKGGAYGMGGFLTRRGIALFSSYRDPHLARTYKVYEQIPDFIRGLNFDEKELTSRIVGAVGSFDRPMTEQNKGKKDLANYLSEKEPDADDQLLQEMANCRLEDLKALADPVQYALDHSSRVTLGSKGKIEEDRELFGEIEKL